MKITTQTRYSMRFLLELAQHEADPTRTERLTTQQIAKSQNISEKYLESIAAKLKKGGLISSSKGVKGGYRLAKPMNQITLGHVMRLMESTYFSVHCTDNPAEDCPNHEDCVLATFWQELEALISNWADKINLEDIKNEL